MSKPRTIEKRTGLGYEVRLIFEADAEPNIDAPYTIWVIEHQGTNTIPLDFDLAHTYGVALQRFKYMSAYYCGKENIND